MTKWTQQELNTLRQNMHFTPSGIAKVIPNRTVDAIRKQRNRMLAPMQFLKGEHTRVGAEIVASLQKRGWNRFETTLYMRACKSDEGALQQLTQRGLWNMECEGVMS